MTNITHSQFTRNTHISCVKEKNVRGCSPNGTCLKCFPYFLYNIFSLKRTSQFLVTKHGLCTYTRKLIHTYIYLLLYYIISYISSHVVVDTSDPLFRHQVTLFITNSSWCFVYRGVLVIKRTVFVFFLRRSNDSIP